MTGTHRADAAGGADRGGGGGAALVAADWLCLAAAPACAVMALLTGIPGGGPPDMPGALGHGMAPLGGMAAMYGLMGAFHSPPWLKRLAGRRGAVRQS